jgi:hypothetical protein
MYVSSVMLRPKNVEVQCYDYKDPEKNPRECREMKPNLSKDRAMHEGDDPSF